MNQYLLFPHRNSHSTPIRIAGIALMVLGAVMTFKLDFWAIPLIPFGLVLLTSKKGVEIDKMQHEYRHYTSYLGYRTGIWHDSDKYPYLSLVKSRKKPKLKNASVYEEQIVSDFYDVCLLSKSHRGRVYLMIGLEEMQAKNEAIRISDELGKEYMPYTPPQKKKSKRANYSRKRQPEDKQD
jgi:hypothetical protein